MRKYLFLIMVIAMVAISVACEHPTTETPTTETPTTETPTTETPTTETPTTETSAPKYYIKNSNWDLVGVGDMLTRAVGDIPATATELVENYNSTHNDDQLFLLDEDVPIEEGPLCTVYMVNEGDYAQLALYEDIDRQDVKDRRWVWELEAQNIGALLFIDKVPPVPVPEEDTRTMHEKYTVAMVVVATQKVLVEGSARYEEHCYEVWQAQSEFLMSVGYPTLDVYFQSRVTAYNLEAMNRGAQNYLIVVGSIWTDPV